MRGIRGLNSEHTEPPNIWLHMSTQTWCFDHNGSVLIAKELVRICCITGRQEHVVVSGNWIGSHSNDPFMPDILALPELGRILRTSIPFSGGMSKFAQLVLSIRVRR